MTGFSKPLTALLLATALAACQQPARSPRTAATAAAAQSCRAEVDRVYAAQNRVDLSTRDQRDTPFAGDYNSGITSQGLGARYGRDNQLTSCLNNSTAPGTPTSGASAPGVGPTFTPVTR
jgi:hypothetical protein